MSGEVKITVVGTGFVVGAETSREIEEQYSRPAPVDDAPVYKGFDPSNLDIPAFLRGRRQPLARSAPSRSSPSHSFPPAVRGGHARSGSNASIARMARKRATRDGRRAGPRPLTHRRIERFING